MFDDGLESEVADAIEWYDFLLEQLDYLLVDFEVVESLGGRVSWMIFALFFQHSINWNYNPFIYRNYRI